MALLFAANLPLVAAPCRQALALAIDVSGSVDDQEYRLQLDGIGEALLHPKVLALLTAHPQAPVTISVYEWSGGTNQRVLISWTQITSAQDAQRISDQLKKQRRQPGDQSTALGKAMEFGAELLRQKPDCWQHTLDISADGMSNSGPRPSLLQDSPLLTGILVNGLVIAPDGQLDVEGLARLTTYFEELIIRGPFSFVEQTGGYEDYAEAMIRKLLRELAGMPISSLPHSAK